MDDTFRLDLAHYDKPYIEEVLDTFIGDAHRYRRKVITIRMSQAMSERLGIEMSTSGSGFKGVSVEIDEIGLDGTIEVVLSPLH
jgi:hypothetical protein